MDNERHALDNNQNKRSLFLNGITYGYNYETMTLSTGRDADLNILGNGLISRTGILERD